MEGQLACAAVRQLVPRLLGPERIVRVLVRDPSRVVGRPWAGGVEIARADLGTGAGLGEALRGVHTAYYLVHSMSGGGDFASIDRSAARRFGAAARAAGVQHVIYLGGLLPKVVERFPIAIDWTE